MMAMPEDPMILYSYINTQLRDRYSSLEELCSSMNADRDTLVQKLNAAGFEYSAEQNRFM